MLWKSVLPVALIVLGIHDCNFKFIEIDKNDNDFVMSMEHVLFHFNENQNDDFAYKFLRVRRSLRKVNSLLPAWCNSLLPAWCLHSFQHLAGLEDLWVCSKLKPRLLFDRIKKKPLNLVLEKAPDFGLILK